MSRDDLQPVTGNQSAVPSNSAADGRVVPAAGQPGHGEFTASLRRQRTPAGLAGGRLHRSVRGHLRRLRGHHPDLDYSQVSPRCSGSAARTTRSKQAWPPIRRTSAWPLTAGAVRSLRGENPALRGGEHWVRERTAPALLGRCSATCPSAGLDGTRRDDLTRKRLEVQVLPRLPGTTTCSCPPPGLPDAGFLSSDDGVVPVGPRAGVDDLGVRFDRGR